MRTKLSEILTFDQRHRRCENFIDWFLRYYYFLVGHMLNITLCCIKIANKRRERKIRKS